MKVSALLALALATIALASPIAEPEQLEKLQVILLRSHEPELRGTVLPKLVRKLQG
ncbi:hypothetical protein VF21_08694 [Pseudogymnoascus sp. 05NY08]|nr:hypothetical protein VF21_08694 [Pseudogymnoascus sp. 05NY08]